MTAEIAIMNKSAIALAADSAITFEVNGEQKVYETVNKLFSLSKYYPIGLMVYGNAEFMGIDWETIVKIYRSRLAKTAFDRLHDHAHHFLEFLENNRQLFDGNSQNTFVKHIIRNEFQSILDYFLDTLKQKMDHNGKMESSDIQETLRSAVTHHRSVLSEQSDIELIDGTTLSSTKRREIRHEYRKTINDLRGEVFEKLPMDSGIVRKLNDIACYVLTKSREYTYTSGVVIAGYGTSDIFPVLLEFHVDGIFSDMLKFSRVQSYMAGRDLPSAIIPFAQSEMVVAFMEGVDPFYREYIEKSVHEMLRSYSSTLFDLLSSREDLYKQATTKANEELARYLENEKGYRNVRFIQPVLRIVAGLPKSELAAMAESLVSLTSFRRRVTPDAQTVGGPIDVAIISRGDGFIWIKRKHYFRPELNQHFLANYFLEAHSGEQETDQSQNFSVSVRSEKGVPADSAEISKR